MIQPSTPSCFRKNVIVRALLPAVLVVAVIAATAAHGRDAAPPSSRGAAAEPVPDESPSSPGEGGALHWWERYPLPASGPIDFVDAVAADALIPAVHVDIGLGLSHIDAALDDARRRGRVLDAAGYKWVPYAEACGTFGAFAVRIEDFVKDETPFVKTTDNHWTDSWNRLDPADPGSITLGGMPAFVTEAPWLLKLAGSQGRTYVRSRSDFGLQPIRFAPDTATPGKVATTWQDVVDAGASKAVDGVAYCTSVQLGSSLEGNEELAAALGLPKVQLYRREPRRGTYLDWGKDILNPFWQAYDRRIVRMYVEELGAWGVHYDNFSGFDFLSWRPEAMGFGDWSVYRFRQYLKEHDLVQDAENFDVRAYVATTYPRQDPRWVDDPVWRAFLVFKRQALRRYLKSLADNVRDLAKETGRDLVIMGNDLPFGDTNGAVLPDMLDVSSSETTPYPGFPYVGHPIGLPPRGRMAVSYLLQAAKTSSDFVFPWYYLHGEDIDKPNLNKVLLFEGLAHQAMLVSVPRGQHSHNRPGDVDTLRSFNSFVRTVRPYWYGRKALANVGLLFSGDSQLADQLPYYFRDHLHVNEFYGWGQFLMEEHCQWRPVLAEFVDEFLVAESDLLIVPHAVSLSESVARKLQAWVASGGRVIITGRSGTRADADGLLARQPNVLAELVGGAEFDDETFISRRVGDGLVVFVGRTPGAQYYRDQASPRAAGRDLMLKAFEAAQGRRLPRSPLLGDNADGDLGIRVFECPAENRLYVDLCNYHLAAGDAIVPYQDVRVSLRLPDFLVGKRLVACAFSSGVVTAHSRLIPPELYTASDDRLDLSVGTVEFYNAVVIRPVDIEPVILVTQPAWERAIIVGRADVPVTLTWVSSQKEHLFGYLLTGPEGTVVEGRTDELSFRTPALHDGTYTFRVWPARLGPPAASTRSFAVDTEGPRLEIIWGPEDGEEVEVVPPGLFNAYFTWRGRDPSGIKRYEHRLRRVNGERPEWTRTHTNQVGFRITDCGQWTFELRAFDRHDHLSPPVSRTFTVVAPPQNSSN